MRASGYKFMLLLFAVWFSSCTKEDKDNVVRPLVRNDFTDTCNDGNYFKKIFHVSPRLQAQYLGPNYLFMEQAWATLTDSTGKVIWIYNYGDVENENALIGADAFFCWDNYKIKKVRFDRAELFAAPASGYAEIKFLRASDDGGLIYTEGQELKKLDALGAAISLPKRDHEDLFDCYQRSVTDFVYASEENDSLFLVRVNFIGEVYRRFISIGSIHDCEILQDDNGSTFMTWAESGEEGSYQLAYIDSLGILKFKKTVVNQTSIYSLDLKLARSSTGGYFLMTQELRPYLKGTHILESEQVILYKLNSSGGIEWQKEYGGEADDHPINIQELNNGQLMIVLNSRGFITSNLSNQEFYKASVIKADPSGNTCDE